MIFAYYKRLSTRQKRIYRDSDKVTFITLPIHFEHGVRVRDLQVALESENRNRTEKVCQDLLSSLTGNFRISPVRVRVLTKRPSEDWGELHGLYEPPEHHQTAKITVWMRTAQRRQVVAFKTFLRTLIHELCHHLDYELLGLADSFHTEGFYKRESSLLVQLFPPAPRKKPDL